MAGARTAVAGGIRHRQKTTVATGQVEEEEGVVVVKTTGVVVGAWTAPRTWTSRPRATPRPPPRTRTRITRSSWEWCQTPDWAGRLCRPRWLLIQILITRITTTLTTTIIQVITTRWRMIKLFKKKTRPAANTRINLHVHGGLIKQLRHFYIFIGSWFPCTDMPPPFHTCAIPIFLVRNDNKTLRLKLSKPTPKPSRSCLKTNTNTKTQQNTIV